MDLIDFIHTICQRLQITEAELYAGWELHYKDIWQKAL